MRRAEYLSDNAIPFRPVLGVVDIEVRKIASGQKLALYPKVFRGLGPPNPTVCVT